MTDSQIIMGLMQNDNRVWRYICRNMKLGFFSTLQGIFVNEKLNTDDLEDIFQDTCVVLMNNVKKGRYTVKEGSSLFSYLVEIGKLTTFSFLRKNRPSKPVKDKENDSTDGSVVPGIPQRGDKLKRFEPGKDYVPLETEEEKQKAQNEFLDRVFNSMPSECQRMFKLFYWDHKSMDDIASIFGMRNADSAKTKKTRCMAKFKEIGKMFLGKDEFPEDLIRATAERAALRELLETEREYANTGVIMAALEVDDDEDKPEDK